MVKQAKEQKMRLWHYKLIPYLPKSQLIAQWRELNSIYKKQDKHILINYIYEYDKEDLWKYSNLVIDEMNKRGFKIRSLENYYNTFGWVIPLDEYIHFPNHPFERHHNMRYLAQCYYNLQEKFDRGQKDFTPEIMAEINKMFANEIMKERGDKCR